MPVGAVCRAAPGSAERTLHQDNVAPRRDAFLQRWSRPADGNYQDADPSSASVAHCTTKMSAVGENRVVTRNSTLLCLKSRTPFRLLLKRQF